MSLRVQHVPSVWKDTVVVPVPKLGCPKMLNDLRPVALTSVVMKIFERFVKDEILRSTESFLDPMQFAYRPKRGVEDATVTLLHLLCKCSKEIVKRLTQEFYLLIYFLPLIQFNLMS